MGKQRRRQERADRRRLRLLQGGGEGGQPELADFKPLKDRPEYQANMAAWRAAGCPRQA